MNSTIRFSLITGLVAGLLLPISSQGQSLEELQQRCEEAREKKLAPLREKAIEECIQQRKNNRGSSDPREECEQFYSDFGQGMATKEAGFKQPMFSDLPECVQFREAEQKQQEQSSGR